MFTWKSTGVFHDREAAENSDTYWRNQGYDTKIKRVASGWVVMYKQNQDKLGSSVKMHVKYLMDNKHNKNEAVKIVSNEMGISEEDVRRMAE